MKEKPSELVIKTDKLFLGINVNDPSVQTRTLSNALLQASHGGKIDIEALKGSQVNGNIVSFGHYRAWHEVDEGEAEKTGHFFSHFDSEDNENLGTINLKLLGDGSSLTGAVVSAVLPETDLNDRGVHLEFGNNGTWIVKPFVYEAINYDSVNDSYASGGSFTPSNRLASLKVGSNFILDLSQDFETDTSSSDPSVIFSDVYIERLEAAAPIRVVAETKYVKASESDVPNDRLIIKDSSGANGPHILILPSSGEEFDQEAVSAPWYIRDESKSDEWIVKGMAMAASTTESQNLIDIGVYNYALTSRDSEDGAANEWYLSRVVEPPSPPSPPPSSNDEGNSSDPSPTPGPIYSPTAEAVLAMSGMGAQNAFYLNQLSDLRKRLGEIRGTAKDGLWASAAAQKDRITGFVGTRFKQDAYRFSFGVDHFVGNWLIGGNFKALTSKQKTRDTNFSAKGNARAQGINLYATWFNEQGCYADLVVSVDRYRQKISTAMLDGTGVSGKYHNWTAGLSAEIGRKISLGENKTWFVEPQAQLSYFFVKGANYGLSNGMSVRQNNFSGLNARLGAVAGKDFVSADGTMKGQVNLRVGVNQELAGKQKIRVNDVRFRDDLIGTRVYYGFGADYNIRKNVKVFGHIERENGSHYTKEIEASVGLKYQF